MHYVIMLIHLMIVVAMVGLVLIQKSEGGGLGMGGGGGGGGFLSSRGTANVLTRTTAILAAMFFVTSLFLSWYASLDRKPRSILDSGAPAAPSAPAVPGAGGGVLNQLGGGTPQQQPAAPPQAPAGPQVPRQ
jgi:preprotein translocase subunit SecG